MSIFNFFKPNNVFIMPCPHCGCIDEYYDGENTCKFNLLNRITQMQDRVNLNLMRDLDDDSDDRWIPIHMMDNANAVILGVSGKKGRSVDIIREGYVEEKINSLNSKWYKLKRKKGV